MLLVWGFKVRFTVLRSDVFHCVRCGVDRPFRLLMARRWFTFFWIPMIPLKELGEVVECGECTSQFDPTVLTVPTSGQVAEHLGFALRSVAIAALESSQDPHASARVVAAVDAALPIHYGDADLAADRASFRDRHPSEFLLPLGEQLSEVGKERVVGLAAGIAAAAGAAPREWADHVGRQIGMTAAHVTGVLATMTTSTDPGER